jgi:anti-sigma regulatory factor (Ser/Thr protein kinase)
MKIAHDSRAAIVPPSSTLEPLGIQPTFDPLDFPAAPASSMRLAPSPSERDSATGEDSGAEALAWLDEARRRGHVLELSASFESLVGLRAWLARLHPPASISEARFELLSTAIYEACANIVEHGCGQDPKDTFEVWCIPPGTGPHGMPRPEFRALSAAGKDEAQGTASESLFLIRDHGIPFRADNWKETDFSDPEVWKRRRGFGLDIIHRVMTRVRYHPGTREGNVTLMSFDSSEGEARGESSHAR